jgi:hypothetical protein
LKVKKHRLRMNEIEKREFGKLTEALLKDLSPYIKDCDSLDHLYSRLKVFDYKKYKSLSLGVGLIKANMCKLYRDLAMNPYSGKTEIRFPMNETLFLTDTAIFIKLDKMYQFLMNIDLPVREVYDATFTIKECLGILKNGMISKPWYWTMIIYYPIYLYDTLLNKILTILHKKL